jgi:hypothetical protein
MSVNSVTPVLSLVAAASAAEQEAKAILETSGVQGGLIVHVGCGGGGLTAALRANDRFLVHGLDASPKGPCPGIQPRPHSGRPPHLSSRKLRTLPAVVVM